MNEKILQKAIIQYLRLKRCEVFKVNSGGVYDKKFGGYRKNAYAGVADVIACSPEGRFIAIEVKGKNGKASEEQKEFLYQIERRGGIAILAYTLNDVIEKI